MPLLLDEKEQLLERLVYRINHEEDAAVLAKGLRQIINSFEAEHQSPQEEYVMKSQIADVSGWPPAARPGFFG
jgi:hypothetical protein